MTIDKNSEYYVPYSKMSDGQKAHYGNVKGAKIPGYLLTKEQRDFHEKKK